MAKIIGKWWLVVIVVLLVGVWVCGLKNMYFHQDDLDWFLMANRPLWGVIVSPIGDHVNYVWRLLLKIEWDTFGFNFPGYYTVSVVLHALVIWWLYLVANVTSGRQDLAASAALLFSVNTNWTETILWVSGQTILVTALFVLLAMYTVWQKKGETITLFLVSWTSGLALGLLGATYVTRRDKRWVAALILAIVAVIYYFLGTDGTRIEFGWRWAIQVVEVAWLMTINSVVGRLIIPFDRWEMARIWIVGMLTVYGAWKWRGKLVGIWRDEWSRYLILQLVFYNLIVAVGRVQYGVGIMRAERYTYLGLILLLLLAARVLRRWQWGKWAWVVAVIVILQVGGFYARARAYVVRPQQLRELVFEVKKVNPREIQPEAYLPHFVLNDERLRYSDLMSLINH
ncbi:MAG: hypothetical protein ABII21_00250 [bacterium]